MKELNLNLSVKSKPFLRWAGGKTWLTKYLLNVRNSNYNNYHEAFLGGAAIYQI
jgi:DNA adenine methylase